MVLFVPILLSATNQYAALYIDRLAPYGVEVEGPSGTVPMSERNSDLRGQARHLSSAPHFSYFLQI